MRIFEGLDFTAEYKELENAMKQTELLKHIIGKNFLIADNYLKSRK